MTHKNPFVLLIKGLILGMGLLYVSTGFATINNVNSFPDKAAGGRFLYSEYNTIRDTLKNFFRNDNDTTEDLTDDKVGIGIAVPQTDIDAGETTNPVTGVCPAGYKFVDYDGDTNVENGECWRGFVLDDGDIGVGTVTPGTDLHVYDPSDDAFIWVDTAGISKQSGLGFSDAGTVKWQVYKDQGATGNFVIRDYGSADVVSIEDGASANSFYINSSGNVGMGTASPDAKLDIDGSLTFSSTGSRIFRNSVTDHLNFGMQDSSGTPKGAYFQVFGNNYSVETQRGGAEFVFDTRNSGTGGFTIFSYDGSDWESRFKIDTDGNVGIGTDSPARFLHLEQGSALASSAVPGLRLTRTSTATPAAGLGTGIDFEIETSDGNNEVLGIIEGFATDVTPTVEVGAIAFKTMTGGATADEKMRISGAGNVGIGITAPTSRLHLPLENDAVTPTLSFGDGDTGFYEHSDDQLRFSAGGVYKWSLRGDFIGSETYNESPVMANEQASSTNPVFTIYNDRDTGIGANTADQLSLIAGAKEIVRLKEDTTEQLIVNPQGDLTGTAAAPSLAFGDGDTGFYESADDTLKVAINGGTQWTFNAAYLGSVNTNYPVLANEQSSATNPNFIPDYSDLDTGLGHNTADQLSLISGEREMMRLVEGTDSYIQVPNNQWFKSIDSGGDRTRNMFKTDGEDMVALGSGLKTDNNKGLIAHWTLGEDSQTTGADLVTNGTFDTDSDWTKGDGWTISGETANCDGSQSATSNFKQSGILSVGKRIKIIITVSNYSAGSISIGDEATVYNNLNSNGIYTIITTTGGANLYLAANSTFVGSIDNVIVKEVHLADTTGNANNGALSGSNVFVPDYGGKGLGAEVITDETLDTACAVNWTCGDGWTIGSGVATSDGSQSAVSNLVEATTLTVGQKYAVTFEITARSAGSITAIDGGTAWTTVGTHTEVITATQTSGGVVASVDFAGSVDNVSVREYTSGQAMVFDGADTKIDTGSDMIGTGAVTIAGWINPSGWGEGNRGRIINNGKFWIEVQESNKSLLITSDATFSPKSANDSISLNQWQFVSVTRETDGTVNFYVGDTSTTPVLSGTADQDSGTPVVEGTTNVIIGNNSGGSRTFDGAISDLRIYDRILSVEEIQDLWAGYHPDIEISRLVAKEDAGQTTLFNLPVSSSSTSGTEHSTAISIDSNPIFKVIGLADGMGGITGNSVTITGDINHTGGFNTTGTTYHNGLVGIGTTTPGAGLTIGTGTATLATSVDDLYVTGNLEVDGDVYLGDDMVIDNVTVMGTLDVQGAMEFTSGDLDMANSQILNIGVAGTDFTATGGLTLADDLTTTATTFNLLNDTATTLNFGGAATSVSIGAATGTTTINNATTALTGNLDANGSVNDIEGTLNLSGNALTSSGALTVTPNAGTNLNVALSTTGDFAVNTDQLVVDTSAGKVGIGTTSPGYKLDVNIGTESTGLRVISTDNLANIVITDDDTTGYINVANNVMSIGHDTPISANNLNIDNSGNVGIGTTSPGSALDVRSNTEPQFTIGYKTSSDYNLTFSHRGVFDLTFPEISTNHFRFQSNGSDQMVILENGNVGIGTTYPDSILHVKGTNDQSGGITIEGGSTDRLAIYSSGNYGATFKKLNAETSLIFEDSTGGSQLVLNSNGQSYFDTGNVGIGTIAPTNNLSVTPSQYSTGTAYQSLTTIIGSGTTFTNAMVGSQFVFANGTSAGTITAFTDTTHLTVSTSYTIASQAYKIAYTGLQVDSTGNVGIGTTSPDTLLDVNSGTTNRVAKFKSSDAAIYIQLEDDTGTGRIVVQGDILGIGADSTASVNNLNVELSTGNVGIGTTTPTAQLHTKGNLSTALTGTVTVVDGEASVVGVGTAFLTEIAIGDAIKIGDEVFTVLSVSNNLLLTINSNHSGGVAGGIAYKDPNLFAIDNGDGVNEITVDNSGNVGIGTTSPAMSLDVYGNGIRSKGTEGQPAYVYIAADDGDDNDDKYIISAEIDGNLEFQSLSTGSWIANLAIDGSTGKVGIGDTSPTAGLTVGDDTLATHATTVDDVYVKGNLEVDGSVWLGDAALDNLTVQGTLSVSGDTSYDGNWNMNSNLITNIGNAGTDFTSTGGLTLAGNLAVGTIDTTGGALSISGTNGVTINPTGALGLDSAGAITIGGTNATALDLSVSGIITTIKGLFNVDEAVTLDTTLGVTGAATFESTLVGDDIDARTATTLLLGKSTATKVEIADTGIETNVQGTLNVDETATFDSMLGIGVTPTAQLHTKGGLSTALTGTVTVVDGEASVVGVGTLFMTEIAIGDAIKIGSEVFTVATVPNNLLLTIDSNHSGGVAGGIAYKDPNLFAIDNGDGVNKVTIDRKGQVGIGTGSPTLKLQVEASGNDDGILLTASDGSPIFKVFQETDDDGRLQVLQDGSAVIQLNARDGQDSYINNGGNFGIGTSTPGAKLEVKTSSGNTNLKIASTNSGDNSEILFNTANGDWAMGVNRVASDRFSIYDIGADTERFRIENTGEIIIGGKVGIGDTSPTAGLTVGDDTGNVNATTVDDVYIKGNLEVDGGVWLGDATTDNFTVQGSLTVTGDTSYDGDWDMNSNQITNIGATGTDFTGTGGLTLADDLTVVDDLTVGTDKLFVDVSAGNVGIGTGTPINKLHLYEDTSSVGSNAGLTIEQDGTGDALFQLLLTGTKRYQIGLDNSDSDKLKFGVGDNWGTHTDLTIDNDGNVGIGTTTPTAQLHTKGNLSTALTGTVTVVDGEASVVGVGTAFLTEIAIGDAIKIGSGVFTVATVPNNLLLTIDSNHSGGVAGATAYKDPNLFAIDNGDAVSKMVMDKKGNVGIGTGSPGALLDVQGTTQNPLISFKNLGDMDAWFDIQGGKVGSELWSIGAQSNKFTIFNRNDSSYRFSIDNDGNVGIGTTSPTALLNVSGPAGAPGAVDLSTEELTVVDGDVLGKIEFDAPLESDGTDAILVGAAIEAVAEGDFSATSNATELVFKTGASEAATQKMVITSGGNVGIGTESPQNKLDIEGGAVIGATYSGTNTAPTNGLLVEGNVGIGTTSPGAELEVAGHIWQTGTGNSVFIGEDAGAVDDLTGNINVFIGYEAGKANTSGSENVAVGEGALESNLIGTYNVAIGRAALTSNTSGYNTAIGNRALLSNTSGSLNTAIGYSAHSSNKTGDYNTVVGEAAFNLATTGNNNVVLGLNSARLISSGSNLTNAENSIFIGRDTRANANSETNQIVIGHEAIGNGSNTATIGDDNVTDVYIGEDGDAQLNTGRILQPTFGNSIFIGEDAGAVDDLTGNQNVFVGYAAGKANTSGSRNTTIGYQSLVNNISGYDNTSLGQGSLYLNTTGNYNVSIGKASLYTNAGNNNTAIGVNSLHSNTTGEANVANGYNSGRYIGSGVTKNETGSFNILIGYDVRVAADGETNQIVIGSNAIGNGSNTATIGDDNVTDVYIGEDGEAGLQVGRIDVNGLGNSVFIGKDAGLNDDLTDNNGIFIGYEAGKANVSGAANVGIGKEALSLNTTTGNTAIGFFGLRATTTGSHNTAIGSSAMDNNITGEYNTAVGSAAMYSNHSSNNTGIGRRAIMYNVDGSGNIALGSEAGKYYSSGSTPLSAPYNSVFLGYNSRASANAQIYEIVIGANAIGNGSYTATLGDDHITDVYMAEDAGATIHAGIIRAQQVCDENGANCKDISINDWGEDSSIFVGVSASSDGSAAHDAVVGYQAANDLCNTAVSGSHVCSVDEITRTIAFVSDLTTLSGWTAGGITQVWINSGGAKYVPAASPVDDCTGWTSATTDTFGSFWILNSTGGGRGGVGYCNTSKTFACCK